MTSWFLHFGPIGSFTLGQLVPSFWANWFLHLGPIGSFTLGQLVPSLWVNSDKYSNMPTLCTCWLLHVFHYCTDDHTGPSRGKTAARGVKFVRKRGGRLGISTGMDTSTRPDTNTGIGTQPGTRLGTNTGTSTRPDTNTGIGTQPGTRLGTNTGTSTRPTIGSRPNIGIPRLDQPGTTVGRKRMRWVSTIVRLPR